MFLGCPYCQGKLEREANLLLAAKPETYAQLWRCAKCYVPYYAVLVRDPKKPPDAKDAEKQRFWNMSESIWQTLRARMRLCKTPDTASCRCDQHVYFRKLGNEPVDGEEVKVPWLVG